MKEKELVRILMSDNWVARPPILVVCLHSHEKCPKCEKKLNLGFSYFLQFKQTGLIGAFLITIFRIIDIHALYSKRTILQGVKPASLFPLERLIGSIMTCSSGNMKKGLLER
jgi:hypothetical protein